MKAIEIAFKKEKENGKYAQTVKSILYNKCPNDYGLDVEKHEQCKGENTLRMHCRECWEQEV